MQHHVGVCIRQARCVDGVADGARTHDNRNHNPGLYQLSYGHHWEHSNLPRQFLYPDKKLLYKLRAGLANRMHRRPQPMNAVQAAAAICMTSGRSLSKLENAAVSAVS